VACTSVDRQEESSWNVEFMALTHPLASSRRKTINQKRVLLHGLLDIQLAMRNPPTYTNIVSHNQRTLSSTNLSTTNLQEYPATAHNPASESNTQGGKKNPH
jgi:hypothetical protein